MKPRSKISATARALCARVDKAVWEYRMFQDHDIVLVAVSGGADSLSLLHLLSQRMHIYGRGIVVRSVYVDMGFGQAVEERTDAIKKLWHHLGVSGLIFRTTIGPYAHSEANKENPCFLCSRIRRKQIFSAAEQLNCNKIVFGHHKDDLVETLLLNMIFGREISTSPPNLSIHNGRYHMVRPFVYADEALIKAYALGLDLSVFSQLCPSDGASKRQHIKVLLDDLERRFPGTRENLFHSMKRVKRDYLL